MVQQVQGTHRFTIYASNVAPIPIIKNEELILLRAEARYQCGDAAGALRTSTSFASTRVGSHHSPASRTHRVCRRVALQPAVLAVVRGWASLGGRAAIWPTVTIATTEHRDRREDVPVGDVPDRRVQSAPTGAAARVHAGGGCTVMDRRQFVETSAVLAGTAALGRVPAFPQPTAEPPMIGIQAGAVSFVDEGTDRVLDSLQRWRRSTPSSSRRSRMAAVSGDGSSAGSALPDHGKAGIRRQLSRRQFRDAAPAILPQHEHRSRDRRPTIRATTSSPTCFPRAHQRGMKVICWFEDVIAANVPGFDAAREVMLIGRLRRSPARATRTRATSGSAGRGLPALVRRRRV